MRREHRQPHALARVVAAACLASAGCDPPPLELHALALPAPPSAAPSAAPLPRADATLKRQAGRLEGQTFFVSPAFTSADGAYDLVVHFHGAPEVVKAAFHRVDLPAVVLLANLGVGSTAYQRPFLRPETLSTWLAAVDEELTERGLARAQRRRLALTAWSAGYGAIYQILTRGDARDEVDAVVLLDGLHSHREGLSLASAPLQPFASFARRAQAGQGLFLFTHSRVVPERETTASAYRCADWLLRELDVPRFGRFDRVEAVTAAPSAPPMRLESEARDRGFVVRGYAGDDPEDHLAHLRQMGPLGLAELARHWTDPDGTLDHP